MITVAYDERGEVVSVAIHGTVYSASALARLAARAADAEVAEAELRSARRHLAHARKGFEIVAACQACEDCAAGADDVLKLLSTISEETH